jgi:Xaa-Pro aminopeptidase
MRERGLAGMVVFAYDRYSPAFHYATGERMHYGIYLRSASGAAHLIHDPMERDQAAAVGCSHAGFPQHGLPQLMESEGHPARAFGRLIAEACRALGLSGRIALLGELPAAFAHALIRRLREVEPSLEIDDGHPDVLAAARTTKSADEVKAIHRVSRGGVAALDAARAWLAGLTPSGDGFLDHGRGPVTLGDLRRLLHRQFIEHGLAEDGASIVAQGRDAGVPHNRGCDGEHLRPGLPILVDIFPGEAGGGYHTDITRTFCLGPAPPELRRIHHDVHEAFRLAMSKLEVGRPCRDYQELVCERFEQLGHATQRQNAAIEEGYVHGLGHGVGLSVHEAPRLGGPPSNRQTLDPGMVISVEPGLYYPSQGLGVRIEDLVHVQPDGTFENLTPAAYELEVHPAG